MPCRALLTLPNVPMHIIQRGNNRQACFFSDDNRYFYLAWLQEYANKTGCQIHAYVLMPNHVHLLVSAGKIVVCPQKVCPQKVPKGAGRDRPSA